MSEKGKEREGRERKRETKHREEEKQRGKSGEGYSQCPLTNRYEALTLSVLPFMLMVMST